MRIAIDLMGSDRSPKDLFEAILQLSLQYDSSVTFIILATEPIVDELSKTHRTAIQSASCCLIEFYVADSVISMEDEPLYAVRHKKKSSLVIGINLLKNQEIDAFISAGNTGALIAGSALMLPMLPGIERPALLATLPTKKGRIAVIDVGGNIYCKAHHLVQFAQMAGAYKLCIEAIACPVVGLLNIGVESKKGTHELRKAYQLLKKQSIASKGQPSMQFIGNIEGREIFDGALDILVTDGFTGNVLLKTTEGAASFILNYLLSSTKGLLREEMTGVFDNLQHKFGYEEYPGAIVCGIEGILIKCHGNASTNAIVNSVNEAIHLVKKKFIAQMKSYQMV